MSDPYLTNAHVFQYRQTATSPLIRHKIIGGNRFYSYSPGNYNLQSAYLPINYTSPGAANTAVPMNGREYRIVGEGLGINVPNAPAPSMGSHYFHTVEAPNEDVTHFPLLRYYLYNNPIVPGCTNPFIRPGAINKFGVTGVEAGAGVHVSVRTPFFGGKQWHSSELGAFMLSHLPSVRFTPGGYIREERLAKATWLCHHDPSLLSPEVAAIVVSSRAFQGAAGIPRYNELTLLPGVWSFRTDSTTYAQFYRPVFLQNNRLLIAPTSDVISTSLDFSTRVENRIEGAGGQYISLYRGAVPSGYSGSNPQTVADYASKQYYQLHSATTEATWLDVTNFPDVEPYDIDVSNNGPPTLLGYGYIVDIPYGLTPASGKCIGLQDAVPILEVLYRVDDNQVRAVFQSIVEDGTPKTCVYTWDYTVESYFTQLGWVLTSNNCGPGYTAVPPYTPGTFQGEKREGTCQV